MGSPIDEWEGVDMIKNNIQTRISDYIDEWCIEKIAFYINDINIFRY